MTAPVFLVGTDRLTAAGRIVLDGPEGHHAATVRRLRPGERVEVSDGAGLVGECVVAASGRDWLELDVLQVRVIPRPQPQVSVVQALPKGERAELAVELMTEVGVDVIVPWSAARCVVQWREDRVARALGQWRSTAREAGKQARRHWLPDVRDLASTVGVGTVAAEADLALLLQEDAATPIGDVAVPSGGQIVLIVGPEGGIAPEEVSVMEAAGARPVRMGPTVLRTSTAGAVAAAIILSRTERWSRPTASAGRLEG